MKLITARNLSLLSILFFIIGCSDTKTTTAESSDVVKKAVVKENITPLVTATWLNEHINDKNLVLLDTSVLIQMDETSYKSISGKEEYEKAHIPNARFADLKNELSDTTTEKEFIMPSPSQFQKAMRDLGVNQNSHIIIYAREEQSWSTRVWWMLKWAGFDRASILNGGLEAWKESGFAVSNQQTPYQSGNFKFKIRNDLVADRGQVMKAITDDKIKIVDSLSPVHYKGDFSMYPRKGHITSAINLPSSNFVDESGYFLSLDDLELMLDVNPKNRMITYCGGGVAASAVAFNLHRAGYSDVAVYMGSLQEWTENADNPMTLGDNP